MGIHILRQLKVGRVVGFGNDNLLTVGGEGWSNKVKTLTGRGGRVKNPAYYGLNGNIIGGARVEENKFDDGSVGSERVWVKFLSITDGCGSGGKGYHIVLGVDQKM